MYPGWTGRQADNMRILFYMLPLKAVGGVDRRILVPIFDIKIPHTLYYIAQLASPVQGMIFVRQSFKTFL